MLHSFGKLLQRLRCHFFPFITLSSDPMTEHELQKRKPPKKAVFSFLATYDVQYNYYIPKTKNTQPVAPLLH